MVCVCPWVRSAVYCPQISITLLQNINILLSTNWPIHNPEIIFIPTAGQLTFLEQYAFMSFFKEACFFILNVMLDPSWLVTFRLTCSALGFTSCQNTHHHDSHCKCLADNKNLLPTREFWLSWKLDFLYSGFATHINYAKVTSAGLLLEKFQYILALSLYLFTI